MVKPLLCSRITLLWVICPTYECTLQLFLSQGSSGVPWNILLLATFLVWWNLSERKVLVRWDLQPNFFEFSQYIPKFRKSQMEQGMITWSLFLTQKLKRHFHYLLSMKFCGQDLELLWSSSLSHFVIPGQYDVWWGVCYENRAVSLKMNYLSCPARICCWPQHALLLLFSSCF